MRWNGPLPEPDVRLVEDMRCVLAIPDCQEAGPLYYMFRDLALTPKDREWLSAEQLRYDITAVTSREICGERAKTMGHYHPDARSGIGYPEIYQVLSGHAHYLLQKRDLSDIALVIAGEGDIVIVPPGYGHVTINAGDTDLLMANIVSRAFESRYGYYRENRGGAFYELADGTLMKNPVYPDTPDPRILSAREIQAGIALPPGDLYNMVGTGHLAFLNNPAAGTHLFRGFLTGGSVQPSVYGRFS